MGIKEEWLQPLLWSKYWYGKQIEFIEAVQDYYEIIFCAGNAAGKSQVLYHMMATLALGICPFQHVEPPLRIKVLVTSFETGMLDIAADKLFKPSQMPDGTTIGALIPPSAVQSMWTKEKRIILLKNGSTIIFGTSEQGRRLASGGEYDLLFCDEEPNIESYDESLRGLRNAKGGGRIFHSFTPFYTAGGGPSWTKEAFIDYADDGHGEEIMVGSKLKKLKVIHACMRNNPAVTEAFIEKFSKGKTEEQLRVQLDGKFPTFGKMVFPKFQDYMYDSEKKEGNLLPSDYTVDFHDYSLRFEMSVDWHASKPTAAIWGFEDKEGNFYVWDELSPEEAEGKTIRELTQLFYQVEGGRGREMKIIRFCDPKAKDRNNMLVSGISAWEVFRQNNIRFCEGYNRQPEVGISIINDYISGNQKDHPRLFVKENCTNLIKSMQNHYYKEQPDGSGQADPKWSDFPICLRYILQNKRKQSKIKKRSGMYNKYTGVHTYDSELSNLDYYRK